MKQIIDPLHLKDIKEISMIKIGEYNPKNGKRKYSEFELFPTAAIYRIDTITPDGKTFKIVTKTGTIKHKEVCDAVNKVVKGSNDTLKAALAYSGGNTLHGYKVCACGKKIFGDLPEIPPKLRKIMKL